MTQYQAAGAFADRKDVSRALNGLFDAGFRSGDVAVIPLSDKGGATARAQTTRLPGGTPMSGMMLAAAGAFAGALIGLAVSAFAPGMGPLLSGGTIAAAIAGAGMGGAAGAIAGALFSEGMGPGEAPDYENRRMGGEVVLQVECRTAGERENAARILVESGGRTVAGSEAAGAPTPGG